MTPAVPAEEAGEAGFEERSSIIQQLMADLEQAVLEVDAVLKDSIDSLRDDAPGKKEARRELAHQLVVGAWLNRENPDWDPADLSTHRPLTNDPLLAMLEQWSGEVDAASEQAAPQQPAPDRAGPLACTEAQSSTGSASSRSSPRARS